MYQLNWIRERHKWRSGLTRMLAVEVSEEYKMSRGHRCRCRLHCLGNSHYISALSGQLITSTRKIRSPHSMTTANALSDDRAFSGMPNH